MNNQIEVLEPLYLKDFHCIGNQCKNNCCHGWTVTIDENTFKKYKKIKSPISPKLQNCISKNRTNPTPYNYGKIKLKEGICPFLNENNLCEIYINIGEQYMCNTCKQYPRKHTLCGSTFSSSLALSCEEACRIALLNPNPMEFSLTEKTLTPNEHVFTLISPESYFLETRSAFITILQNRDFSIQERLLLLGMLSEQLDDLSDKKQIPLVTLEFVNALNNKEFIGFSKNIQERPDLQFEAYQQLFLHSINNNFFRNAFGSSTFTVLNLDLSYNEAKEGLTISNSRFKSLVKRNSYIFENYFVNCLIDGLIYIKSNYSYMKLFLDLILRYSFINISLASLSRDKITIEECLHAINSVERQLGHSSSLQKTVDHILEHNEVSIDIATYLLFQ